MTELTIITELTHYVDAYDLTRFLSEHFGKKVEHWGSRNDTDHLYDAYKDDLDEDDIEEFLAKPGIDFECYGAGPALQYLVKNDLIPEGAYVVRVSW